MAATWEKSSVRNTLTSLVPSVLNAFGHSAVLRRRYQVASIEGSVLFRLAAVAPEHPLCDMGQFRRVSIQTVQYIHQVHELIMRDDPAQVRFNRRRDRKQHATLQRTS